jgi:hypothetical protein
MKKCPTCDKTYDDSMRFCQIDGASLVDDAPSFDPYATIVGRVVPPADEVEKPSPSADTGPTNNPTIGSIPISEPDDVLDLPSSDPLKTMYVSESEMREALDSQDQPDIIEIPAIDTEPAPAPPSFIAPEPEPAPEPPAFSTPPPSPFGSAESTPVSSPFTERELSPGEASISAPTFQDPEPVRFDEAATIMQSGFEPAFNQQQAPPPAEWTPPAAPEREWQNQPVGAETPFQPPVAGADGANKSLAVASLVLGLLSFFCLSLLGAIPAIILGFMQKSRIKANPSEYGGGGFATAGIVLGGLYLVVFVIVMILYAGLIIANLSR